MFVNEISSVWSASRTHSNGTLADRNECLDAVVDGLIGFIWGDGIAGADVNFNLEVGKRLDTFAVDGGALEFDGGGEVDDVNVFVSPFVSPTNEDILAVLGKLFTKKR